MNYHKERKLYVFGAGGMLGAYLCAYFQESSTFQKVIGLDRSDFEVTGLGREELNEALSALAIEEGSIVINAIGLVPQAEDSLKEIGHRQYFIVNGLFPHYLVGFCAQVGAHLFQISTDCVFSGRRESDDGFQVYLENSACDETHPYGLSKSLGEPLADCCSVLRSSLIGEDPKHGRSLLQWVLDEGSKNAGIKGYKNHFWNGITCLQLCHILQQTVENDLYWRGVRHFFSPDRISKFELVCVIVEAYGLDCQVEPYFMPEKVDKCLGSLYELNDKMEIPNIRNQISELLNFEI